MDETRSNRIFCIIRHLCDWLGGKITPIPLYGFDKNCFDKKSIKIVCDWVNKSRINKSECFSKN